MAAAAAASSMSRAQSSQKLIQKHAVSWHHLLANICCQVIKQTEVVNHRLSNYILDPYIFVILQGAINKHGQTPKKSGEDDSNSTRFSGSPREPLLGGIR